MGTLSSIKPDTGRTFTYTFVAYGSDFSSMEIALTTGWTLVGYPSPPHQILPEAHTHHGITNCKMVTGYHTIFTAGPWILYEPSESVYTRDLKKNTLDLGFFIQVDENVNRNNS